MQYHWSCNYIFLSLFRRLFALSETTSGEWTSEDICLGSQDDCHNGLVGHSFGLILSFAEDPDGDRVLYFLTLRFYLGVTVGGWVGGLLA